MKDAIFIQCPKFCFQILAGFERMPGAYQGGEGRILEVAERISEVLDSFPKLLETGDKPLSKPMIA